MTETVDIRRIKENPENPRTITDEKLQRLVESIQGFPEMLQLRPLVVNEDLVVLGGNMRLKAAKLAGLKELPIIRAANLTEEQQREFIIKDNVGFGDWDWDALRHDWGEELLAEWGLDLPPVAEDIELFMEAEEDEFQPEDGWQNTDIVEGDLIEIGPHKLVCGSSREIDTWRKLMGEDLADLVVTDPPYNVNYKGGTDDELTIENDNLADTEFFDLLYDAFTAGWAFTKAGGAWYVWHADTQGLAFRRAFTEAGFDLKQCLIWVKNALVLGRQDYQWKHEPCLYGWKPGAAHYFVGDRTRTTVIEDKLDLRKLSKKQLLDILEEMNADTVATTVLRADKPTRNGVHPTMKPIKLLGPLIQNSSRQGEIVADGFGGSGSTMVACHQLKRKARLIELDPKYCQATVDRMRQLEPGITVKRNGKKWEATTPRQKG
jgi:site-specific DNA-methyltransferase (adenine-specific)